MASSRGKQFEERFKRNWIDSVPDSLCYRLYDTMGGFKAISNVGDFICYKYPFIYLIDCKSIKGNTLPFSDLRQLDQMLEYINITGINVGFIVWFINHDKILWIPAETMNKIKLEGLKSFNINKMKQEDYFFLDIPSKKLRTFMNSDYSWLTNYYKYVKNNTIINKSDGYDEVFNKVMGELNESTN